MREGKGNWKWSFGRNGENHNCPSWEPNPGPQQTRLRHYHWATETSDITRHLKFYNFKQTGCDIACLGGSMVVPQPHLLGSRDRFPCWTVIGALGKGPHKTGVYLNHAGQVDTTHLQVRCAKKLRNPSSSTGKTDGTLSFCLGREADIVFSTCQVLRNNGEISCVWAGSNIAECVDGRFGPPLFLCSVPPWWSFITQSIQCRHWSTYVKKPSFIPHARIADTCRTSADTLPCQSAQTTQVMSFAQT